MSPILVRPVREQLEHDRLIRYLLLNKYKRRFEANGNVGDERQTSVKIGSVTLFPDIVLTDGKKPIGLVEVETGESVNNLEALAEWVHFAKARVPFYLYVPMNSLDSARRLCEVHQLRVAEIWSYRGAMDGFDLVRVHHDSSAMGTTRVELVAKVVPKPLVPVAGKPGPEAKTLPPAAEPKPLDKLGKAVKVEPPPVKPEKSAKVGLPAKVDKAVKVEKSAKVDKPTKIEKPTKTDKPLKAAKPAKRAPEAKAAKKVAKSAAKPTVKAKAAKTKPSTKSNKNKKKR